ncbi:NADH-quinone oxidoreductase subunit C [Enemella sp. A6]|uniref:NADH-quinone oxidoreductase subunit C n=1 Tax=Enemella sp. A6 TaxID=3440152 RepID=UPI003EB96400
MLTPTETPPEQWAEAAADLHAEYPIFDWLGAVDDVGRSGGLRVVLQAMNPDGDTAAIATTLPRENAELPGVAKLWPGAAWCEREGAEAFGIVFTASDARPLLLRDTSPATPLRKDVVLAARTARPWPGAGEPGGLAGSRRTAPAGVPDPAVWGNRNPDDPADPAEIAASLAGGRRRRR